MSDIATEDEVKKLVLPILNKWFAGIHLTEFDAYCLLNCFEDVENPYTRPVRPPLAIRRRLSAPARHRGRDGLTAFAEMLQKHFLIGKDLRTLREWCKRGFIPGAYQTPGRHWRVKWVNWTPQQESAFLKSIEGHARKPQSLLRSPRWKAFKKKLGPVFVEFIPLLRKLDAEFPTTTPEDLQKNRPSALNDKSLHLLDRIFNGPNREGILFLKIWVEARRLYLKNEELTFAALANELA